jgi:hypothetical protein
MHAGIITGFACSAAADARQTDANVVFQTLPDALTWLWQGYGVK